MDTKITFQETRRRLAEDRRRLREVCAGDPRKGGFHFLDPSYQAAWLHRWSHYCYRRGNRLLARFLWHVNLWVTGADISPISDIGEGMVLHYPLCMVLVGKIGKNMTAYAHSGIGGGMASLDIGAGPGLPVVGDDVTFECGGIVLGPVRIGNGVRISARCLVTTDLPDGAVAEGRKARVRQQQSDREEGRGDAG